LKITEVEGMLAVPFRTDAVFIRFAGRKSTIWSRGEISGQDGLYGGRVVMQSAFLHR